MCAIGKPEGCSRPCQGRSQPSLLSTNTACCSRLKLISKQVHLLPGSMVLNTEHPYEPLQCLMTVRTYRNKPNTAAPSQPVTSMALMRVTEMRIIIFGHKKVSSKPTENVWLVMISTFRTSVARNVVKPDLLKHFSKRIAAFPLFSGNCNLS